MAKIETLWVGDGKSKITHTQSGTYIFTDAPVDNHGKGEYLSPTDLVAAALGSCMITIMNIYAVEHGMDLTGTRLVTEKVMASDPRRIAEIHIDIYFKDKFDAKQQTILKRVAETCPVGKSLHPDLKQDVRFHFGEE